MLNSQPPLTFLDPWFSPKTMMWSLDQLELRLVCLFLVLTIVVDIHLHTTVLSVGATVAIASHSNSNSKQANKGIGRGCCGASGILTKCCFV
jgi:hypothetical protein